MAGNRREEDAFVTIAEEGFYTRDGDQWACWVHFAPSVSVRKWPPVVVERALQFGCLGALHVLLHELYGCGFIREPDGTIDFFLHPSKGQWGAVEDVVEHLAEAEPFLH